jgi:cytochrome c biogenesis protein CcmG, thiol:disulfide interchange protein DsbE
MKRLSILFVALLFVSGCTTTPSAISKGEVVDCSSLSVDSTVSGTELECLDGSAGVTLEALRGPAVVNVWGSWCGPCQDEIPLFVDFYGRAKGKVTLLGIDVEEAQVADGRHFVQTRGITWPNLYDPDGRTASALGMGVPITYFVDAQGVTVYKKIGVITSVNEIEQLTQKYLGISI